MFVLLLFLCLLYLKKLIIKMCGGVVFFPHINNNTSNTYENLLYFLFCAWLIFFLLFLMPLCCYMATKHFWNRAIHLFFFFTEDLNSWPPFCWLSLITSNQASCFLFLLENLQNTKPYAKSKLHIWVGRKLWEDILHEMQKPHIFGGDLQLSH